MPKKLTSAEIAELADSQNTEGLTDGKFWCADNLYLQIRGNSAAWLMRYTQNGRLRTMGLGSFKTVTFTEAKRRVIRYLRIAQEGGDPIAQRREEQGKSGLPGRSSGAPTFKEMARDFLAAKERDWKGDYTPIAWRNRLRDNAYPVIGAKPVDLITIDDVAECVESFWRSKHSTAKQTLTNIRQILEWAETHGHRSGPNPARLTGRLKARLGNAGHVVKHFDALPYPQVPALWKAAERLPPVQRDLLRFNLLTATRPSEADGADWSEMDLETAVWTIPPERFKGKRQHRVPLSDEAVAILESQPGAREGLVFKGARGGKVSDTWRRIRGLGFAATMHGTARSSFADWCREAAGVDSELRELSLGHQLPTQVMRAYSRSDLLELRRGVMDKWAAFLTDS